MLSEKEKLELINDARFDVFEIIIKNLLTYHLSFNVDECQSYDFKKSLIEAKQDLTKLSGPIDLSKIEYRENAVRFLLGKLLSDVQAQEKEMRSQNRLPQVKTVIFD